MTHQLRLIDGAHSLRETLRSEGFSVPDRFAEGISAASEGATTIEQYQAQCDGLAERYLADFQKRPPSPRGSIEAAYNAKRDTEAGAKFAKAMRVAIDSQKDVEASRINADWPILVRTKAQLRGFAEEFAARRGFRTQKRGMTGAARVMQKGSSHSGGCVAELFVDAGGRRGDVWSSNQTTFLLGDAAGRPLFAFKPFDIVRGMEYYGSAQPSLEVLEENLFRHPGSDEEISRLLKVGVAAEIVFLDLLVERVVCTAQQ